MNEINVIKVLKTDLNFSDSSIKRLKIFHDLLLEYNKSYNLISKSTENNVWFRHILDSAQILKFLDRRKASNIADFGSGAGFPGLIIAIQLNNTQFHVKLYEKSAVKREFLNKIKEKLGLENIEINGDIYKSKINSSIITCRAFKKLGEIVKISREIITKPHKMIILKGKDAQSEINNVSLGYNYSYKLEKSITDHDSKIIVIDAK
jgi:16S rRNA (guanine527-N7)-methyltransferase